jgi:hypothetical protein
MVEYLLGALIFTVILSAWVLGNQLSDIASSQRSILRYLDNASIHNPYNGDSSFRVQNSEGDLEE